VLNQQRDLAARLLLADEHPPTARAYDAGVTPFAEAFAQHLKLFRAAPFLFVGAGLSRRYLELDGWEALLRRLASLSDSDFDYYNATANGDFPEIAHLIAEELHDRWWKDPAFRAHRAQFKGRLRHRDSALKAEASIYLADSMKRLPTTGPLAAELAALRKVVIDGVITTNFDPLLEHLFPDFRVFVGQERLLFNDALGVAEIYKIHGSHEDPDSLVLTTADYERFRERNAYLAAKLMTIFVEHPVVFLGYSISDPNVAAIVNAIVECLDTTESISRLADRLIFVQWDKDAERTTMARGVMRVGAKPLPVMSVTVPDYMELFEVLGALRRGFPAKLLRQLKEQVYDLVLEAEPKARLHVLPLESNSDLSKLEVVFGVGAIAQLRSYVGLQRDDLVADVVDEGTDLNAVRVVQEALPPILSQPGNVPIFKYLRQAGLLDQAGALIDPSAVNAKVVSRVAARAKRLGLSNSYRKSAAKAVQRSPTLRELVDAEEPQLVLQYIPALDQSKLDPEELRRFLIKYDDLADHTYHRSQWIKMACLFDWLRYGRQSESKKRRGPRPRRKGGGKRA
jgi:hypothetical protein